jgi:hypothetical protein
MTKLTDITPEEYRCSIGACPAIFRTPEGQLVIIGKRYINESIAHKIGIDEAAVTIPKDILKRALKNES